MIRIKSNAHSFTLNGKEFQKGTLTVSHDNDGVAINGIYAKLEDIECDGISFTTKAELETWISDKLFKNGGGTAIGVQARWGEITGDINTQADLKSMIEQSGSVDISGKVDKVNGLGLSETSFTQAEKTKLSTIVEHFAGRFVSLDDLNAIVGNPGGYAYVSIDSAPTVLYAWNAQTSTWDSTALAVSEESPESIKTKYETNPDTNSFTDAEKAKLSGVAAQATKNDTDANLKNRANHTGSQPISTITDLLSIINSINSANDLQNTAIQGKADTIHTHTIAGVTGLQGALDGKVNFPGSNARIPTRDSAGNNNSLPYATASQNGSVPVRNEVGNFQVSTPIGNTDVANKSYVDASDITLIGQTTSASAAQTLTINIPATAPELLRIEVFVPDTLQSAWIGMRLNGIVTSVYKSVIQGVNNASYVLNRYVNETQISLSRGGANDGVQTGRYNVRIEGTITNVSGQLKIFHGSAFTSGSLVTDLPDISNTWGSAHEASITSGKITQIQLRTIPASAGFSAGSRLKVYGIK